MSDGPQAVDRQKDIEQRVLDAIPNMSEATAKRTLQLVMENTGYLGEHNPEGDEQYGVFPCSDATYHLCSFSSRHSAQCEQGKPTPYTVKGEKRKSPPCPVPCDEGSPMPWCHVSGHNCPDCALVVQLRQIVEAVERGR